MGQNWKSSTAIANSQDFDTTFTNEYSSDQTGAAILTPTAGTCLALKGAYITTAGSTGEVRLTIDGNTVVIANIKESMGYVPFIIRGLRNSSLQVTSNLGSGNNYFILVNYREE